MHVKIPLLLLALLLLWFPRSWLRLGRVLNKRRSRSGAQRTSEPWKDREPGDPRVHLGTEYTKLRNYVDLIRAAAGAVCVMGEGRIDACIDVAPGASARQVLAVLAIKALILVIAVLIQTVRYEKRRLGFYPPIFFLAGVSVPLCSIWGALFAFALVWGFSPMLGNAQGFLLVYAVLLAVFGNYFGGLGSKAAILASLLCFLPVLLSLLTQKPLVVFTRSGMRTPGEGT